MYFSLYTTGLLVGLLASMPLGPISILIIHRTLSGSRKSGLFSALGTSISDTIYASIAGLSVGFVTAFIQQNELLLRILGAIVLCLLGMKIFFDKPKAEITATSASSQPWKLITGTFLFTFSNPMVVFIHLTLLTAFQLSLNIAAPLQAALVIAGFFSGAILWWSFLTGIVSKFRHFMNQRFFVLFNRITGGAIVLLVLGSLIYETL